MGGFGMYLGVIGDIAGTDIWIVDRDLNLITGKVVFSEDFSTLLSERTLTVGAPIVVNTGDVIGAVLLHSPIKGTNEAISQGVFILIISILLALIVSILLSVVFSFSFTKPLGIMKKVALRLTDGEYTAKTNIKQDDEIGELANTLDILAERLDLASQESEKLETMRREFVANVSHELKTPVTVMRGSLEALVDQVVTDPVMIEEYHMQMLKESKFLQRLVEDLLELSKLQSMDFVIEKTEISLFDVIEEVTRSANHLANKRGVSIMVRKDMSDYKIIGDYGRIRQMIMIILDNAIKFSPKNEIVQLVLENNRLYIKDQGIGIEAENLPYIFDRFYKSRSEKNKTGTGLGLSIAKNIAGRHHIKLTAESTQGEGAKFVFDLQPHNTSQKEKT